MRSSRTYAKRVSAKLNDFLATRMAKPLGLWMGCGYPRSGTTWVCRLLSSYLELPWAKNRMLPAIRNVVLHSHFDYHPSLSNCFYVYRDGRDVIVSQYFSRVRLMHRADLRVGQKWQRIFSTLFGAGFDSADIRSNLPRYLEFIFTDPIDSRDTWPDHIQAWVQPQRDNIAFLSYEDLLEDAFKSISTGLNIFLDKAIDEAQLRDAIEQVSFAKWTGRQPGVEAPNDFFRKGVAGDWRNHFTREAADIFAGYAGDTLVTLGYEDNLDWVKDCPA